MQKSLKRLEYVDYQKASFVSVCYKHLIGHKTLCVCYVVRSIQGFTCQLVYFKLIIFTLLFLYFGLHFRNLVVNGNT